METPRNLPDACTRISELAGRLQQAEATISAFEERMDSLEHAQNRGLHAARSTIAMPPFPKVLEDIGLRPPKPRKAAA